MKETTFLKTQNGNLQTYFISGKIVTDFFPLDFPNVLYCCLKIIILKKCI